jgi:hypothetical protein
MRIRRLGLDPMVQSRISVTDPDGAGQQTYYDTMQNDTFETKKCSY